MSATVCLLANALGYPEGGGHLWVYLNWALGLRANGCRVIWLEGFDAGSSVPSVLAHARALKERLAPYGLGDDLALCAYGGEPLRAEIASECLDVGAAIESDLLLNFAYGMPAELIRRFRRTALVDIDPGLLQTWMSAGAVEVAPHDMYFTIGETVGRPEARFPDAGLRWQYTQPCVATDRWPVHATAPDAPFTTVSHWSQEEWLEDGGECYQNDKRSGFLPFVSLPTRTNQPLELALCLGLDEEDDRRMLLEHGWRIRDSGSVTATPSDYQRYIQQSRGEFSCAKPSCMRLQNAWISDRTLCYLASGKPAVVQHTGPSRFLPDCAGLFRFRTMADAAGSLEEAAADYEQHCRLARALAETHFDARKVTARVLERTLD